MYDGWRKWQGLCFLCIAWWMMHHFLILSIVLSIALLDCQSSTDLTGLGCSSGLERLPVPLL